MIHQNMVFRGEKYRAIKDPLALKYYHLQPEQFLVLDSLDGLSSLEEIRNLVQKQFPMHHVTTSDIQLLILDLHRKGLVQSMRTGQATVLQSSSKKNRWNRFKQAILNPFFIKFPGWNPARLLEKLNVWLGWIFTWPAAMVACLIVIGSWVQLGIRYEDLRHKIPAFEQYFGWPNTVYLWLTIGVTKLIHELGHGIACRRFGCRCHSIGIALLVFSPTMFCDATDSWMLQNKWKRIAIAAAGMYVEVVLSAIAIFLWSILQPGLLENLCLNVFFVSALSTVIFNANPLIKFDGYYILSDFLEIPNLREKSRTTIQQAFGWAFGLKLPKNPFLPKSGQLRFGFYAMAATLYGWIIMFSIGVGMYEMLKPFRLESIGASLGVFVVATSLFGIGSNLLKTIRSARNERIRQRRFLTTSLLLAFGLLGVVLLPFPLHIRAPFVLESRGMRTASAIQPGMVKRLMVAVGDTVRKGDALAILENEEIEDRVRDLRVELMMAQAKLKVHGLLQENDEYAVSEDAVRRIEIELQEWTNVLNEFVILAPCDGTVLASPRQISPKREILLDQLSKWIGNPLSPFNEGAFLESGTQFCEIAQDNAFDAVLLVDQHDRVDMLIGQKVRLLCESFPHEILDGQVVEISQRHLEYAPRSLSNKLGGDLATITDAKGRERLNSNVYQIRIAIAQTHLPFKLAMRGHAKLLIVERSAGQWIWRFVRQTFLFRL